jgi:uncharacterized protein
MNDPRLERLRGEVRKLDGGVAVAFSGGVDSALLLKVCVDELGDRVLAVTADSPSYPAVDRGDAVELARRFGASHLFVRTAEMEDERYRRNESDRCYVCKHTLFETLLPIARERGLAHLAFGANKDDEGDFRPGHRAAAEFDVRAPLLDADLRKEDVRELCRALDIPVWNKPASACLASRIPYGTRVDPDVLARIERAEAALRELGFAQCRVRHHGDVARVELAPEDLPRALADRDAISKLLKDAGYLFVALDLDGYRSGSLNRSLESGVRSPETSHREE